MKVLLINGSARGSGGNTAKCLEIISSILEEEGIETETVNLNGKKLNPCLACYKCKGKMKCVQDDDINDIFQEMLAADGIILGSPTYFSNVTSRMAMLIERTGIMARTNGNALKGKVGAAVAVARRAGMNFVYSALNYFFGIAEMPIATSSYWNNCVAGPAGTAQEDEEGMKVMKTLARNMATMLKKLA